MSLIRRLAATLLLVGALVSQAAAVTIHLKDGAVVEAEAVQRRQDLVWVLKPGSDIPVAYRASDVASIEGESPPPTPSPTKTLSKDLDQWLDTLSGLAFPILILIFWLVASKRRRQRAGKRRFEPEETGPEISEPTTMPSETVAHYATICPNCGAENPKAAKHCLNCRTRLRWS